MKRGRMALADDDATRCEALTIMTSWKQAHKAEERCPFRATWMVQDHQFCRHHAVSEVFAMGIESGVVQRLTVLRETNKRVRIFKS